MSQANNSLLWRQVKRGCDPERTLLTGKQLADDPYSRREVAFVVGSGNLMGVQTGKIWYLYDVFGEGDMACDIVRRRLALIVELDLQHDIRLKRVAEAVMEHAHSRAHLTLGEAAFSVAQMQAIEDQLEILRRNDPSCEAFFADHPHEPFFVKNLENVQGDERDVVFISVGYGKIAGGYVPAALRAAASPLHRIY